MTTEKSARDLRAHSRHQIGERCTLTYGGSTHVSRAVNVSVGGALVAAEFLPGVGETVLFAMDHMGPIQGRVVRVGPDDLALCFDPAEAKSVGINDMVTFVLNKDLVEESAA